MNGNSFFVQNIGGAQILESAQQRNKAATDKIIVDLILGGRTENQTIPVPGTPPDLSAIITRQQQQIQALAEKVDGLILELTTTGRTQTNG